MAPARPPVRGRLRCIGAIAGRPSAARFRRHRRCDHRPVAGSSGAMKPITVSVDVPQPRERVFAFLDVMRNHEAFNDHMLTDWSYAGPARGVGSRASVRAKVAGKTDSIQIETVASVPPARIVEHNV